MKSYFSVLNLKNKKGISLIEVMIVSVILGLVLVGVMSVFNIMLKQDQFQKQRVSVFDNIQTIKSILSRPENCLNFLTSSAFYGTLPLTSINSIKEDGTIELVYSATASSTNGSSIGNNVYIDKINKHSKTIDQIKNPSTTSSDDDDTETSTDDKSDTVHTIEVIYKKESSLQSIGSETFKRLFELVVKKKDGVDEYENCRYGKEDVSTSDQGEVSYPEPVAADPIDNFQNCPGTGRTNGGVYDSPTGKTNGGQNAMHGQTYLKVNYGNCYQDASDLTVAEKEKIHNKWIDATEVQTFTGTSETGIGLFIPETYQMPHFDYCNSDGSVDNTGFSTPFFSATHTDERKRCYHNCITGNEDDCKNKWITTFYTNGWNPQGDLRHHIRYVHLHTTNYQHKSSVLSNNNKRVPGNKIHHLYYRTDSGGRDRDSSYNSGDRANVLGSGSTCSFLCAIKAECAGGQWRVDAQVCKAVNSSLITGSTQTYIESKITEIETAIRAADSLTTPSTP